VGNQIDFGEAGRVHIPGIGLQRNVVLQPGSRLGAAVPSFSDAAFPSLQAVVDSSRADAEQLPFQGDKENRFLAQGIHTGSTAFKRAGQG
jgi:hypothetical protein